MKKLFFLFALLLLGAGCEKIKEPVDVRVQLDQPLVFSLSQEQLGAPSSVYQKTIIPLLNNNYDLGTASNSWKNIYSSGTLQIASVTSTIVTTTNFYGGGLYDCDDATNSKVLWNDSNGKFSCGTDQSGGGGGLPFVNGATVTGTIFVTDGVNTSSFGMSGVMIGNGVGTSTLAADYLAIATSTSNSSGTFYVLTNGDTYSSGTLFRMIRNNAIVSSTHIQASTVSVTGTFYLGNTNGLTTFTPNSITYPAAVTITGGSGNAFIFSTFANVRIPVNMEIVFDAGFDQFGRETAPTVADSLQLALDSAGRSLIISDETDIGAAFSFNTANTDPTLYLIPTETFAAENRFLAISAGETSTTIRNGSMFLDFRSNSSTFRFANTNPAIVTTSIMVTSTGSGGSAFTMKMADGGCAVVYVGTSGGDPTLVAERCNSAQYLGVSTTFP